MGECNLQAAVARESQGLGRTRPLTREIRRGDFASSASSLNNIQSQSNYDGATTKIGATSSIRNQIMAEV